MHLHRGGFPVPFGHVRPPGRQGPTGTARRCPGRRRKPQVPPQGEIPPSETEPRGPEAGAAGGGCGVRIATSTHADTQDYLLLDEDGTPVARIQFTLGS